MKRFVLAYSGGLDTSVILKWLQVTYGAEVVTLTADLGQQMEIDGVKEKALRCGATQARVEELSQEFLDQMVWPALKAGALYQGVYPMATALGRPMIVQKLVEVAREVGADAIVHGCTGKGNDQVRFELGVKALAPEIECVAPLRFWDLHTREDEIAWAEAHDVPVAVTRKSPYSIDENLWGLSIEAGPLEDPWAEPPADCWQITTDPDHAPAEPEIITVTFESGVPVAVGEVPLAGVDLVKYLNQLGGTHGVGRIDMVEDRLVGIKSREVYEAPAATILHAARRSLEQLTLDRETRRLLAGMGSELARLTYDGLWYSPAREAIGAFVDQATQFLTGEAKIKLHRGAATVIGARSPYSLYQPHLATYGEGDEFNRSASAGFIEIFGLGNKVASARQRDVAEAGSHKPKLVRRSAAG